MDDVAAAIEHNWAHFMKRGPGLSYGYQQFVIARCPSTGQILHGGLGGMGIGEMWSQETPEDAALPGYAEAEIVDEAVGLGA